jgi:3-demethoxyubiquinol 3-hydroxylase
VTAPRRLPGDRSARETVARMIRVDQAGEYGARRIYDGQLAVLGRWRASTDIQRMTEQEQRHLDAFNRLLVERRVRPTILSPLWHMAGFALGAATAMLGERAAMACTVAVEDVIGEHYRRQIEVLGDAEPELTVAIAKFRKEELEHRETALAHGAERAPAYRTLTKLIAAGTRLAIFLSERV